MRNDSVLIFRKFEWSDLDAISGIENRSFEVGPYSGEEIIDMFANPLAFNYVAVDGDKIAGYVVAIPLDNSSADVESIAVDPSYQGSGVGSKLLAYIEEEMKARGFSLSVLEVREKNQEGLKFYEKNGYKVIEKLNNYYSEHFRESRHAVRMTKILK